MNNIISTEAIRGRPIETGLLIALTPYSPFFDVVDIVLSDDQAVAWLYVRPTFDITSAAYAVIFATMGIAVPAAFSHIQDAQNERYENTLECEIKITAQSAVFRGLAITNSKKPSASAKRSQISGSKSHQHESD